MQRFEVGGIVALNAPVLCLDTCSLLDMMRDPTRDTVREPERRAVYDLLTAAEGRATLIALVADQVVTEFGEHVDEVEKEAAKALQKLRDDLARIDAVAAAYGSGGPTDISHLDDHVTRARGIVDRWFAAATPCQCRVNTPQKGRVKFPQFDATARLRGDRPGAVRPPRGHDPLHRWRGSAGGQTWGSRHDSRSRARRADGVGDLTPHRPGPENHPQIHRPGAGAAGLHATAPASDAGRPL